MSSSNKSETSKYDQSAFHATADLGDLGCGDLVLAINEAMQPLVAGEILRVRALDPGARIDIPAWCRMRGHSLLAEPTSRNGGFFFIRKGDY